MKINSQRPKSHYAISRSSSHLSIQRPKSLPGISKRPFSTPNPIKPPLIYSRSSRSTNSSLHSSAMRSPPPSAKINVIHPPIDLSQYDASLPQTHAYPLNIVAIYYITLIYTIIYSFCINIVDILKRINNTDYIKPQLFKKAAIERLIALQQSIFNENYEYKLLDGSIIDIKDKYVLIELLVKKLTVDTIYNVYIYLRAYLRELKYDNEKIKSIVTKESNKFYNIIRDDELQSYIDRKLFTPKIRSKIISWFDNINIEMINNKLKSQFKIIEELISILNDIWVDEKTKGGFIKFILKTQKTSGIQSGGMLSFLRSNRVLPESDQVVPMNMRAKTGRTQQIIKLYNSMRTRSNRVLPEQVPEQVLHLNMYRRAHTANFQNIYDYLFLLNSYLFEVDDKMMQKSMKLLTKYYKKLIRDYEKEYKHIYKDPPIQKESIRSPMFLMNSEQYKLKQIPTFTEMKQKNEDLIALKLKKHSDRLDLEKLKLEKHIRGQHIKFHLKTNTKYIKDSIDSVEKDLAHLFP